MIALRQAQSLAQQNEWTDAFDIASKIEKDYPAFEQQYEVDYLLGRCLAMKAEFDAARQMYKKVIRSPISEKTETAAMAQWMIGESYFHQKNFKAAAKEYQQLEILYAYPTWQAASLLQAGKCRERLGEKDEAAKLYRRVVKVYHDTSFAKDAAHELARLEGATSRH
jgi:TolA-binding protein